MTYTTIQQQLEQLELDSNAAEVHGQLCGLLCTITSTQAKSMWFASVLASFQDQPGKLSEKAAAGSAALAELDQLFSATCEQLDSADMDFALLIENESTRVMNRMTCLSDWCSGFVYGFGMGTGNRVEADKLPDDLSLIHI